MSAALEFEKLVAVSAGLETNELRKQFHAYKGSVAATNREYTSEIMNLFANLDFSDKGAVKAALNHYGEMIRDTENTFQSSDHRINKFIEEQRSKLEGREQYVRYTPSSFRKKIEEIARRNGLNPEQFIVSAPSANRPKSPDEIVLEYAKEAYQATKSANDVKSNYAALANSMLGTYKFIAEQHKNFGDWAAYYRESMGEDSELKKQAAAYTDNAVQAFKKEGRYNTLEKLMSAPLTPDQEALAYRAYGDAFLTQKADYYDEAQKNTEEYGYRMGKQYSMAAKILSHKVQEKYGNDMDTFKLQFRKESFLSETSGLSFMEQLIAAIESVENNNQ